jgi:hypothetical protein
MHSNRAASGPRDFSMLTDEEGFQARDLRALKRVGQAVRKIPKLRVAFRICPSILRGFLSFKAAFGAAIFIRFFKTCKLTRSTS